MSQVVEILAELERRGITVRVEGANLKLKPVAALEEDLLARLRAHKLDILDVLARRPAFCARSCYEILLGKWVHRPWDGCRTLTVGAEAPHLQGEGSNYYVQDEDNGTFSICEHDDGGGGVVAENISDQALADEIVRHLNVLNSMFPELAPKQAR
jgi:hypothetical protein